SLTIILLAARVGGDLAIRVHLPEVLGELGVGVLLGNLTLFGVGYFDYFRHDEALEILSELGVILLLFEVGLETNVAEMMKVGFSSLLVAVLGVITPFFLGWGVAAFFAPDAPVLAHAFVGAALTATSVGITARVLKDLGKVQTSEAKIILGAAVIDDVLGLLVLAIISGMIGAANEGGTLDVGSIVYIVLSSVGFLVGAIYLGGHLSPIAFKVATCLQGHGVLMATSLAICFGMAFLAAKIGLAPIVGAFTAGLILDAVHYKELSERNDHATIEHLVAPLTSVFVPIFFVIMGVKVNISEFLDPGIIGLAVVLTFAAIVGKQVCAFGVLEKGLDRFAVGLGMIPRGEVGLIFAGIGSKLLLDGKPVVDSATYGAVVFMVIVTTMVTPPLVKWRFQKHGG
ncbi:MAG: cation:proton antiporter, partial [bacterium]|nr:cation:proton antiporter [bacterium]